MPDHSRLEPLLHFEELLHFSFHHPGDGDSGPLRHHLRHILGIHLFLEHLLISLQLGEFLVFGFELSLELGEHAVAQLGGAIQIALALHLLLL